MEKEKEKVDVKEEEKVDEKEENYLWVGHQQQKCHILLHRGHSNMWPELSIMVTTIKMVLVLYHLSRWLRQFYLGQDRVWSQ